MPEPQAQRVAEMESILDETTRAISDLTAQLDALAALRDRMKRLFDYYGSEAWYADREGPLPPEIKAGVLSEDLVYDQITDLRDASFQMLELAADLLKNVI